MDGSGLGGLAEISVGDVHAMVGELDLKDDAAELVLIIGVEEVVEMLLELGKLGGGHFSEQGLAAAGRLGDGLVGGLGWRGPSLAVRDVLLVEAFGEASGLYLDGVGIFVRVVPGIFQWCGLGGRRLVLVLGRLRAGLSLLLVVRTELLAEGIVDLVHSIVLGVDHVRSDVAEVSVFLAKEGEESAEAFQGGGQLASAVLPDRLQEGRQLVSYETSHLLGELLLQECRWCLKHLRHQTR